MGVENGAERGISCLTISSVKAPGKTLLGKFLLRFPFLENPRSMLILMDFSVSLFF